MSIDRWWVHEPRCWLLRPLMLPQPSLLFSFPAILLPTACPDLLDVVVTRTQEQCITLQLADKKCLAFSSLFSLVPTIQLFQFKKSPLQNPSAVCLGHASTLAMPGLDPGPRYMLRGSSRHLYASQQLSRVCQSKLALHISLLCFTLSYIVCGDR